MLSGLGAIAPNPYETRYKLRSLSTYATRRENNYAYLPKRSEWVGNRNRFA